LKNFTWFFFLLIIFSHNNIFAISADIIVSKDGSGNFMTIQEALNSIPENEDKQFIIYIKNGIYYEKLFIEKNNIALIGENRDSVKIIFAELRKNWKVDHPDDYGSAVINIKEDVTDLFLKNLTVHNNYGSLYGDNDHQFAIRGGGNKIIIVDCNIIADGGDTLSLWNSESGMYYHKNCYFEGYVDFVCPRGWCYITDSKFFGHNINAAIWHDGSKNKDQKFVIRNSSFYGITGFGLGRFHRDAQFFLIDCTFSSNMADKKIYFKQSDPPRTLQWGMDRIYFYNCHGEKVDYPWHANNLELAEGNPSAEDITPKWVFKDNWDPERIVTGVEKKFNN